MIEKLKRVTNKKIFHLVMVIVIISTILFVSGIIILKYNVEGETNMPFSLTKIILISQVDGVEIQPTETENKKEIVYTDEDGESKPITEKVVMPVIEGAIITAQGASNSNVKTSIISAVEAVTGLAVHKIQVFEMKDE